MKLNTELLVIRGVISSLDEQQQAKVTEYHKHLKNTVDEYKGEGEVIIALTLLMAEISAELE
ncbi:MULTISPECIES: hypothetical protein [Yersinia]|uniref:Uncharacterized protein n=1 Tax=Yersinia proxima TaxID=2890316 RepID=A0ABW9EX29_9GAMM|nr:hypothetical protein [Yersinia proxima]HDM8436252.1 hypothetical protein [Yersinia enterocolitica]HEN3621647.1 hypothetical protein [Yersinia enterocolitica]